ncbi:MAG: DsbA family protein [Gammaproteobacteria bacterium]|nr:DsbA family protein [Gammaproteobacteria bacterium]
MTTRERSATDDGASRVLAEADDWQRVMSLEGETSLDVYLDMKSPHAYLAVRPTLEIARDYAVRVNFLPYTLSYATLGLTTSVEADMKRRPATASADRKARMYYAAARKYAAFQGLPFRSPYRLLDSNIAHRAFLFAKAQHLEVVFLMNVYVRGWGSGWREYELESIAQLRETLIHVGAKIEGFEAFMSSGGQGEIELDACMKSAEASGFSGVPHYVFYDVASQRQLGLFGREHLTLIRENLSAQGLARSASVRPEFSHAWRGPQ